MEELGLGMENIMENMEWVTNAAEKFEKIEETRKWLLGRKITSKEGENKKNKKQPTKKLNLTVNHCYLSCVYMNIT